MLDSTNLALDVVVDHTDVVLTDYGPAVAAIAILSVVVIVTLIVIHIRNRR